MTVIIYGDFNRPYSYLASQRADLLIEAGVAALGLSLSSPHEVRRPGWPARTFPACCCGLRT